MVSIREVIDLLKRLFDILMEFLAPLFEQEEEESPEGENAEV